MGSGDGTPPPRDNPEDLRPEDLAATVERLRAEVARLRRANRRQKVIEQAKGLLAERTGCTVDGADEHLLTLARDCGVPRETAAAMLLGSLPPPVDDIEPVPDEFDVFDPRRYLGSPPGAEAAASPPSSPPSSPPPPPGSAPASPPGHPHHPRRPDATPLAPPSDAPASRVGRAQPPQPPVMSPVAATPPSGAPRSGAPRPGTTPAGSTASSPPPAAPAPSPHSAPAGARARTRPVAVPRPRPTPEQGPDSDVSLPPVLLPAPADAWEARLRLAVEAIEAARGADELAGMLCRDDLLSPAPEAVLFAAVEPDGALRMIGSHGLPPHVVSAWARIPPNPTTALVQAVDSGRPLWPPRSRGSAFTGQGAGVTGERACLPLRADDTTFAGTEIVWPAGTPVPEENRRYIGAVVAAAGRRLWHLLTAPDGTAAMGAGAEGAGPAGPTPAKTPSPQGTAGEEPRAPVHDCAARGGGNGALWMRPVLDAIPDPAMLLGPVRDAAGAVVDFVVDACNAEAADAAGVTCDRLLGRRLTELSPAFAGSDLLVAYADVVTRGVPLQHGPREYQGVWPARMSPSTVHVRRLGRGLLVSRRLQGDIGNLATQLRQAQRLGNLGWSEWNLADNQMNWSHHLYTIFGRDPSLGPFTTAQLSERVLQEDRPIAQNMMRLLLERRETVDTEFRIRRGDQVRRLRVMAEPVLGPLGEPTALRSVYQDVTKRRRIEQALRASQKQLKRQRRRIEDDRHLVVEFQRSVLPLPDRYVEKPGLRAAVRYLPAGSGARVGGDWYETTAIDAGGVFLAIGDASGHGLKAAAAMARLRNALSGLAFTGAAPDALLGWLNLVALHWPGSLTATVVAARYDPDSKEMAWAQAGHLPPLLIREGRPALLDPPEGVLLGATEDADYATQTLRMRTGDVLVLYTDGLIERRARSIQDGLDLLVRAALGCDVTDPDQCVEHLLTALGAPNPNDDTCVVAVQFT